MHRFTSVVALSVVTVLGLSACSSSGQSSASSDSPAALAESSAGSDSPAAPDSGDTGPKVVTVLDYIASDPQKSAYDAIYAQCEKATGYTFNRVVLPQANFITKVTQISASGEPADIIVPDGGMVPALADAGVLQPLNLDAIGITKENYLEGPFNAGNVRDEQYALPVGSNGEILIYNKKMLDDAGIAVPKSWAELQSAAQALNKDGVAGFAATFGPGEAAAWDFWPALWSNGGSIDDLTSPQAVEAMDFWTSFILNGTAPKASLNWQSGDIEQQVVAGKLAMGLMGTWYSPTLVADAAKAGVEIGTAPQVSANGDAPVTPFGGEVMGVGVGAKDGVLDAVNKCLGIFQTTENAVAYATAAGYVPDLIAAIPAYLAEHPEFEALAEQLKTSRSRTTEVGALYDAYSKAIQQAVQSVASGQQSAEEALQQAKASAGG